jgi:hypothetical protein
MYELLLRTETLLTGLTPPVLLGIGAAALVIGLIFWLAGTRYSTAIVALLGALIGSAAGLLVSQRFGVHPWLSMIVGAVVLAGLAILLKKVLVLILAVLILSAVSGAGYVSVVLDRMVPPPPAETGTQQTLVYQSFMTLEPGARQSYLEKLSPESKTFADRFEALLRDTWQAIRPHTLMALVAIAVGAVVGLVLVWLIAKVVIALAYSIVGTAAIFLGLQAALLAVKIPAASELYPRPWALPIAFLVMVVIGWVWQLFYLRTKPVKEKEVVVKEETERP